MEIIEVKDQQGQVIMRHTSDLKEFYKAFSKCQIDIESFSASARNPHFKNDFSPLPSMLVATNEGLSKVGIAQQKHLAGVYLITRDYHIESGQFVESWAKIPALETDINKFKGILTSLNRYATSIDMNIGSEKDDDSESMYGRSSVQKPWINNKISDEYKQAVALITSGEIKSQAELEAKFNFNLTTPIVQSIKKELISLIK
jgi:hypothetical protein